MSEVYLFKRARKTNFSDNELSIMTDEVTAQYNTLFSSFSSTVNNKLKANIWNEIAKKINATTAGSRTGTEIRKKWNDFKWQTKKKAIMCKKERRLIRGGNGLTRIEEKVLSLIPICQIEGIVGGMETDMFDDETGCSGADGPLSPNFPSDVSEPEKSSTPVLIPTFLAPPVKEELIIQPPVQNISMIELQTQKLEVLEQLLSVEKDRLCVERNRLAIEERRLSIEEEKLSLMKTSLKSRALQETWRS